LRAAAERGSLDSATTARSEIHGGRLPERLERATKTTTTREFTMTKYVRLALASAVLAVACVQLADATDPQEPLPKPVQGIYDTVQEQIPPLTVPPNPPPPSIDPSQLSLVDLPHATDSYGTLCEKNGMAFALKGGLIAVNPDTGTLQEVQTKAGSMISGDIPDRYEAARCSPDGGRTWGNAFLDFYVPNWGASSGPDAGVESLIYPDENPGEDISDDEVNQVGVLLASLMDAVAPPDPTVPAVPSPTLPAVPAPLYTINVRYRGASGLYQTATAAGVIGVASQVPITNYYSKAAETLTVMIGPSQSQSAEGAGTSSGYSLTIERGLQNPLACYQLEADVSVSLTLSNPDDITATAGKLDFGYTTIASPGIGRAPARFVVTYEDASASGGPTRNDFTLDVAQTPSCNRVSTMNIAARYVYAGDPGVSTDNVDLALNMRMLGATSWNLARRTEGTTMRVTSTADATIREVWLTGTNRSKSLRVGLTDLPAKVEACSDRGNRCAQPWRADRGSDASFRLTARDVLDRPQPFTVTYFEYAGDGKTDMVLTLSDLAFDLHIGTFNWKNLLPWVSDGALPMWMYYDSNARPVGGYLYKKSDHEMRVNIGWGTSAATREFVISKKKWFGGMKLTKWGWMSCQNFSFGIDQLASGFFGKFLGTALCY
jgi:hypothetical protein